MFMYAGLKCVDVTISVLYCTTVMDLKTLVWMLNVGYILCF
jgi:hypothetical protein